jgi:hypothetical protein
MLQIEMKKYSLVSRTSAPTLHNIKELWRNLYGKKCKSDMYIWRTPQRQSPNCRYQIVDTNCQPILAQPYLIWLSWLSPNFYGDHIEVIRRIRHFLQFFGILCRAVREYTLKFSLKILSTKIQKGAEQEKRHSGSLTQKTIKH